MPADATATMAAEPAPVPPPVEPLVAADPPVDMPEVSSLVAKVEDAIEAGGSNADAKGPSPIDGPPAELPKVSSLVAMAEEVKPAAAAETPEVREMCGRRRHPENFPRPPNNRLVAEYCCTTSLLVPEA